MRKDINLRHLVTVHMRKVEAHKLQPTARIVKAEKLLRVLYTRMLKVIKLKQLDRSLMPRVMEQLLVD